MYVRLLIVCLLALGFSASEISSVFAQTARQREEQEQLDRERREAKREADKRSRTRRQMRETYDNAKADQAGTRATRTQRDQYQKEKASKDRATIDIEDVKGGAAKITAYYQGHGSSFEDTNYYVGGLWSNEDKKVIMKGRINNDIKAGKDPREVLETAFGPYVNLATARYGEQGQKIIFDDSLTALDKTLALYGATKGADVPKLKDGMRQNVEIHLHMDQAKRDVLVKKLPGKPFAKIYSSELAKREANPTATRYTINSQADAEKLAVKLTELWRGSNHISRVLMTQTFGFQAQVEKALGPNWYDRSNEDALKNLGLEMDQLEGSTFDLALLDANPATPRMLPGQSWVMIEYDPRDSNLYRANQGSTFNITMNGRHLRVFESLSEISDAQLNQAIAIHTSSSNFASLQQRIAKPAAKNKTKEQILAMMDGLDTEVYQSCATCIRGLDDEENVAAREPSDSDDRKSEAGSKPTVKERMDAKRKSDAKRFR